MVSPTESGSTSTYDPGADNPLLDQLVQEQSSAGELAGSLLLDITEYLPNVRFQFEDGSPDLRLPGVAIGPVLEVSPLAAFSYRSGPSGEPVDFDDPRASVVFAEVTVGVDEGWLSEPTETIKMAIRLRADLDRQEQMAAIAKDWGTAIVVPAGGDFNWSGVKIPGVRFPGLGNYGFGRVTADGTLRFDGMKDGTDAERQLTDVGISTVQDLREAAKDPPRVVELASLSDVRSRPEPTTTAAELG
jgi:hypothetical protein